jgi:GntR family transcriptional regulator
MANALKQLGKPHLDRRSFKPIYFQLSELIQNHIEDGKLLPGAQLPSERELMVQFDISRNTVRLAFDYLLKAGLVYRIPAKGTFVASGKIPRGLYGLSSFSEEMQRLGRKPGARLLDFALITPSPRIAQALRLSPTQQVYKFERLRFADGEPMALNTSYIPVHLCPELSPDDLIDASLYAALEQKYGLLLWRSERVVEPVIARDYEVELLEVLPGSALLLIEGATYLVEDQPIEYVKAIYRSDRFQFSIQSLREPVSSMRLG